MHSRRVSEIRIPNLPIATEIDNCTIYLKAKLHKAPTSLPLLPARLRNQGMIVDFGFVVESSNDSECVHGLSGLRDEMCSVLLRDHFSNTLYGAAILSNAPPSSDSPNAPHQGRWTYW